MMQKLNELVELAKKATPGNWEAYISNSADGTFSVHTPEDTRKGDIINWPGFDTANCPKKQKSANARFIAAANPQTILAIAESFRALEQRIEAAEAKLAELEKQEPFAYTDAEELETMRKDTFADMFTPCDEYKSDPLWIPLFTRPAPAADLAELVPDGWKLVPVEPTPEMRLASRRYVAKTKLTTGPGFYRAMLAAAPEVK